MLDNVETTLSLFTTSFIAFDFIKLPNLTSYPNNLVEVLFIRDFLVDCLICLNISSIVLKILKSFSSGSILINLQPSFSFITFCFLFCSQYFCHCVHFHHFLLRAYNHENISQF